MNRPTRVPASSVVKMNTASNMIAKWYHTASKCCPNADEKIVDLVFAAAGVARPGAAVAAAAVAETADVTATADITATADVTATAKPSDTENGDR